MKMYLCNSCVVLLAIGAAWNATGILPATAEEVDYHFDFNDGLMPDDLLIMPFTYDSYANPSCEVLNDELRIYDTVSAGGGMVISPFTGSPDTYVTDTHSSALFNSTGGALEGLPVLTARATGPAGDDTADWYECWVSPNSSNASVVQMGIIKTINYEYVASEVGGSFELVGPFVMEFDVTDGKTPEGFEYTDLVMHVTYDDGQQTKSLSLRDWGMLGGYPRIPSGAASFGVNLPPRLSNAGWVLDETIDDVAIRGTLVPEPTVILLGIANAVLLAWRRTR